MQIESIAPSLIAFTKPKELSNLKQLAKRFAISIGSGAKNTRDSILSLHRTGILFAVTYKNDEMKMPSPHLLFFEILNEFTNNLLNQDKLIV